MGKQKHDIGWKKRQPSKKPEPMEKPGYLARQLVDRGLASKSILDFGIIKSEKAKEPAA